MTTRAPALLKSWSIWPRISTAHCLSALPQNLFSFDRKTSWFLCIYIYPGCGEVVFCRDQWQRRSQGGSHLSAGGEKTHLPTSSLTLIWRNSLIQDMMITITIKRFSDLPTSISHTITDRGRISQSDHVIYGLPPLWQSWPSWNITRNAKAAFVRTVQ